MPKKMTSLSKWCTHHSKVELCYTYEFPNGVIARVYYVPMIGLPEDLKYEVLLDGPTLHDDDLELTECPVREEVAVDALIFSAAASGPSDDQLHAYEWDDGP